MGMYKIGGQFMPDDVAIRVVHCDKNELSKSGFKDLVFGGFSEIGLEGNWPDALDDLLNDDTIGIYGITIHDYGVGDVFQSTQHSGHVIVEASKGGWIATHLDGSWTPLQRFDNDVK